MRTLLAAALGLACWLSPAWGGCPTKNCTELFPRPLEPAVQCFGERAALHAVIEEQAEEIAQLRADLARAEYAALPEPVVRVQPVKRKPCKRGRSRNSAGVCGRWN